MASSWGFLRTIARHTVQGIAIAVDQAEFNAAMGKHHPLYPEPYILLAHGLLQGLVRWINANNGSVGRVAYFFEDRDESRPFADALIKLLTGNNLFGSDYRYGGHGFIPKLGNPGVQAADLLVWQWLKDYTNRRGGRPRRKDLVSLLEHHHSVTHVDPEILKQLAGMGESVRARIAEILSKGQSS
jgi:hypothetical protein